LRSHASSPAHHPSIDGEERLTEILRAFRSECQELDGIRDATVFFQIGDQLTDPTGRNALGAGRDDVLVQAFVTASPVRGARPDDGSVGIAYPLGSEFVGQAVVWFEFDDPDDTRDEHTFSLDGAVRRLGQHLTRAADIWVAERRRAALDFAHEASRRYLEETSLHRALRLNVTGLADLIGVREAAMWRLLGNGDPVCLSQVRRGSTDPERDDAMLRLVRDVASGPGPVIVLDTRESKHFAWCASHGIERFMAHTLEAFDQRFGVLLLVDFQRPAPLVSDAIVPGVAEAAGIMATATTAALSRIDRQDVVARLNGELRNVERLLDRAEREAAHFDLCQRAAEELQASIGDLRTLLPQIEEPLPEVEYVSRMGDLQCRTFRASEVLEELIILTSEPPPRLTLSSLNDVIHSAVEQLRSTPGGYGANVSLRLQGDLPPMLLDQDKIRRALTAVLGHGLAGTENREAVVTSRAQKGEAIVELRVPDRDVPGGVLESLFAPFVPAEEYGSRSGLSLADQIVGEHGGQLRARSEPGEGLLYWLSLPVTQNQDRRQKRGDRRGLRSRRRPEDPDTDGDA